VCGNVGLSICCDVATPYYCRKKQACVKNRRVC
jgi:hypothetical protein